MPDDYDDTSVPYVLWESEPGKKHDSERQKDDLTGKTVPDDEADDDAYKLGGGR
jgi:hypothetical protein